MFKRLFLRQREREHVRRGGAEREGDRGSEVGSVQGAWVAQLVGWPTSAQVMISQFVSSSPALSSVLTAQSLEPASDSVCVCLSLSLPLPHSLSLSVSQK